MSKREKELERKLTIATQLIADLDALLARYRTNSMHRTPEVLLDRIASGRAALAARSTAPEKKSHE